MNYYEHHLGDYAKDAGHLSLIEEGAYRRLLDAYYTRERPLPADLRECCKLARAVSKVERDAVAYVLAEFFTLDPDGGHRQSRADAEISRFQDKQRKAKASAEARWATCERNANASANAMRTNTERNANGMHRAPVPSPQSPVPTIEAKLHGVAAKPPRATRKCPAEFVVTEDMADWAKREAPSVSIVRETASFRDHTFRTAISDWRGAWRNWMRKASAFGTPAAKTTARQAEVAKWLGPLAKQGEIIDMEEGNGPRIAMG